MQQEFTTGIKLPLERPNSKVIAIVRKETSLSIGNIIQRALDGEFIISGDPIDEDEYLHLLKVYDALQSAGCNASLFEDGEEITRDSLARSAELAREISMEVDRITDLELGFIDEEDEGL